MSQATLPDTPVVEFDGNVCRVSGVLDFTTARSALEKVEPLIKANSSLEINLAGVSHCNSAGLALMIEWLALARREKHSVTFHQIPNSLRQLANVCQVDGLI